MLAVVKAAVVLTVAGLVLAAVGSVAAASPSPDTVGGRLAAVGNTVTVTSQGSVPTHVTLSADVVRLDQTSLDLQPGESEDVTFTGDPLGRVYATFAAASTGTTSADSNNLVLSVGLKPYTPPFNPAPWAVGALFVLAFAFLGWRAVRWGRRHIRFVPNPA